MKFYQLSQLPFQKRYQYVSDLIEKNIEVTPDVRLIKKIFDETIEWFKKPSNITDTNLFEKLKNEDQELPPRFKEIYEIKERSILEKLSNNERQRIFNDYKEEWYRLFPDFKRIVDVIESYLTNEILIEYCKNSQTPTIHDKAIEVYKKCISFKVKLTKKVLSVLIDHPDKTEMWCNYVDYCIDKTLVKSFLKEYKEWNNEIRSMWDDIYYLKQDFFVNAGYRTQWDYYVKNPDLLKAKADEIQKTQEDILSLLNIGKELVNKWDEAISSEYEANATEMSIYERELEIKQMGKFENLSDEEYCYVYTLECNFFIFYVGIAADPKQRFEQHIRGAFGNEAHLFKSKFIQKFNNEIKQNVVYEGTRRECRKFEKDYISKYNPLGNMTTGGEG